MQNESLTVSTVILMQNCKFYDNTKKWFVHCQYLAKIRNIRIKKQVSVCDFINTGGNVVLKDSSILFESIYIVNFILSKSELLLIYFSNALLFFVFSENL